jgi:hypothetical protein
MFTVFKIHHPSAKRNNSMQNKSKISDYPVFSVFVFFVWSYGPLSSSVNKDTYDIPVGIVNKRWRKILTPARED